MPNIGAARISTANKGQYLALIKKHLDRQIKIDRSRTKKANIKLNKLITSKINLKQTIKNFNYYFIILYYMITIKY